MESVEASGKSVDDAIVQALARLGRRRDEVEVTILQEPSRGVRGVGSREARVRVWLKRGKPAARPAPSASAGAVLTPDMADQWIDEFEEPPPTPVAPQRVPSAFRPAPAAPAPIPTDEDDFEDDDDEDYEDDEEFEDEDEEAGAPPPVTQPQMRAVKAPAPVTDLGELERGESADGEGAATDAVARQASDILRTLLRHMQLPAAVEVASLDPLTLNINLNGDPDLLSMLIGRRGETLSALQLIANLMLNHKVQERYRLMVDVEHYRQRRDDNLRSLALRVAQQVQQSQRSMTLEPMTPYERRIVHLTLQESPYVQTQSSGEGEQRRVVVSLKRPTR